MDLNPPLVGRDQELEVLYDHLAGALSGKGGLILVSGEAGIGKTRILDRLGEAAAKTGFCMITGGCVPGAPLPYMPFYEAFQSLDSSPFSYEGVSGPPGPRDPTALLFESLELMTRESQKQPLLVCLEDLHWADPSTIQLIHFLARNVRSLRVMIVGTYRPEDLMSSVEGETHPLQSGIRLMSREGILTELHLARIGQADLSRAIEGMLGSKADAGVKARIYEHSGGNPLFAVETLRMLVTEGRLVQRDGIWVLVRGEDMTIPPTIHEVILRRIDKLSKEQRRILECASVIGEAFDPFLISESMEAEEMHVLDLLDGISVRHQLVVGRDDGYSFTHAKIKEVTYDAITRPKRAELHRRVAMTLEKALPDNTLLSSLSWHFCKAREREKCLSYSIMAGESFMLESYFSEGITHFKRALESVPDDEGHLSQKRKVLEGLGDAYREQCLSAKSMEFYDLLLKITDDPRDRARVLWKSAENWNPSNLGKGDLTRAMELLKEAESSPSLAPEDMANIEYQKAFALYYQDLERASVSIRRAIDLYAKAGNEERMMEAMKFDCFIKARGLRKEEALKGAQDFSEKAYRSKNRKYQIDAEWALSIVKHEADRPDQALVHLSRCQDLATKSGDLDALFHSHITKAELEEELGDFRLARKDAEKALDYAIVTDDTIALASAYTRLGRCSLNCGDQVKAEAYLERASPYVQQLSGVVRDWFEGLWLWSEARLEVARGADRKGGERFDRAIGLLQGAGSRHWDWAAMCRYDYAKSLIRQGSPGQAKEQLEQAYRLCTAIERFSLRKKVEELRSSLK